MQFEQAWLSADYVKDTKIITITPQIAEELLTRNLKNRKIKSNLIKRILDDIRKGRWETTHQSIAIDFNDDLIDGQHRLTAILQSGQTVRVRITRDCIPATMNVVDTGKSRSNSDMLTMSDYKNSTDLAATIKQCYCYQYFPDIPWHDSRINVTFLDLQQTIEKFQTQGIDYNKAIIDAKSFNRQFKFLTRTPCATFLILCQLKGVSESRYIDFLDKFVAGENLDKESPLTILRKRWINGTKTQYPHSSSSQIKLAELIHFFKLYRDSKRITKMPSLVIAPMPIL